MKLVLLALCFMSLSVTACAEYPQTALESSGGSGGGSGGGNNSGQGGIGGGDDLDTEPDSITLDALHFRANCGEGFVSNSSPQRDIFISKVDDTFFVKFDYRAADGDSVKDGQVKFFYQSADGEFSLEPSTNSNLFLTGLTTNDVDDIEDPNALGDLLNSGSSDEYNSFVSYSSLPIAPGFSASEVSTEFENALSGQNASFDMFSTLESIIVISVGHLHNPKCINMNWTGDTDETTFTLHYEEEDGGSGGHDDHDHEGDHEDDDDHDHEGDHEDDDDHDHKN